MLADVPEQPRDIRSTLVAKTEGSGEPLEGLFYIEVAIEEVFQFRLTTQLSRQERPHRQQK